MLPPHLFRRHAHEFIDLKVRRGLMHPAGYRDNHHFGHLRQTGGDDALNRAAPANGHDSSGGKVRLNEQSAHLRAERHRLVTFRHPDRFQAQSRRKFVSQPIRLIEVQHLNADDPLVTGKAQQARDRRGRHLHATGDLNLRQSFQVV